MRDSEECTCNDDNCYEHTCPYQEDIYGDSEFTCECCMYCTNECAMDI